MQDKNVKIINKGLHRLDISHLSPSQQLKLQLLVIAYSFENILNPTFKRITKAISTIINRNLETKENPKKLFTTFK